MHKLYLHIRDLSVDMIEIYSTWKTFICLNYIRDIIRNMIHTIINSPIFIYEVL